MCIRDRSGSVHASTISVEAPINVDLTNASWTWHFKYTTTTNVEGEPERDLTGYLIILQE